MPMPGRAVGGLVPTIIEIVISGRRAQAKKQTIQIHRRIPRYGLGAQPSGCRNTGLTRDAGKSQGSPHVSCFRSLKAALPGARPKPAWHGGINNTRPKSKVVPTERVWQTRKVSMRNHGARILD